MTSNTRNRLSIAEDIAKAWEKVEQLKEEIKALTIADYLLCDEKQHYKESEEEIIISKRPTITIKAMIGRIHWKQEFIDQDTGESVFVERSEIVRRHGVWLI